MFFTLAKIHCKDCGQREPVVAANLMLLSLQHVALHLNLDQWLETANTQRYKNVMMDHH
jgi:hypothetical protein